jgi:calcineurin-like phosphoesterase family protein
MKQLAVAVISDPHLGHPAIAALRGYDDIDEYNEVVIERWNSVCGKNTLTFLLGDISMEKKKYYPLLDRLNGRIAVCGGNHDLRQHSVELMKHVESISGCIEYKGCILSHMPIHPMELNRYIVNIHGHTHSELVKKITYRPMVAKAIEEIDLRYKNVSWEQLGGVPMDLLGFIDSIK